MMEIEGRKGSVRGWRGGFGSRKEGRELTCMCQNCYMFSSLDHFNCAFRKVILQETEAQVYSGLLEVVVRQDQNPVRPLILLLFCTKIDLHWKTRLFAWSWVLSPFLKEAEVQSEQDGQECVMLYLSASQRATHVGLQDLAPSKVTFQCPSPQIEPKSHCFEYK